MRADAEAVGRAALAAGQILIELKETGGDLEDLFFRLTSHDAPGVSADPTRSQEVPA